MKSKLALVLLVLLVAGFATQVQANRIKCPWYGGYNTYAHYKHVGCPNGAPPFWPQWSEPAMAPGTLEIPPPLPCTCPLCSQSVNAVFCWCANESISMPFWP
jgi:hypothetical protein